MDKHKSLFHLTITTDKVTSLKKSDSLPTINHSLTHNHTGKENPKLAIIKSNINLQPRNSNVNIRTICYKEQQYQKSTFDKRLHLLKTKLEKKIKKYYYLPKINVRSSFKQPVLNSNVTFKVFDFNKDEEMSQ